jgi:hypothetical protein
MNLPGERLDLLLEKEGIPFEYFDRLNELAEKSREHKPIGIVYGFCNNFLPSWLANVRLNDKFTHLRELQEVLYIRYFQDSPTTVKGQEGAIDRIKEWYANI